ncbi:MAG: hypothetical protein JWM55_110 [Acidimicrobiaceae bacterium]|nr:hypothetical protein [Acidimicrobiaceae bacterium]
MTFRDASPDDQTIVEAQLKRPLSGRFAVVVRRRGGEPVVIENEPHLRDATPMPTLYWLVDAELYHRVSQLESNGGVHRFEDLVDQEELQRAHDEYAQRRREATVQHEALDAHGGVGGTRRGVKCLHAHLANYLAGWFDPVGALVADEIDVPELLIINVRE